MENCALKRPPKLHINIPGFGIAGEGALGIAAAFFLVVFLVVVGRWF
jgi:hypothetical protein